MAYDSSAGIEIDPRLPSPFTPHGRRPEGPAWYATPTVAYAKEVIEQFGLPVELRPLEAFVRGEAGPYVDPWYKHLAEAYKSPMADLGVTADLSPAAFLDAMAGHKASDPGVIHNAGCRSSDSRGRTSLAQSPRTSTTQSISGASITDRRFGGAPFDDFPYRTATLPNCPNRGAFR